MYYLLKTEPSEYSFQDLQREKRTLWEGVTNPQAVKFLREMQKGDQLVFYHTGKERRAVGSGTVLSVDTSDPKKPLVTVGAGKALANPLTLDELKKSKLFKDSPLVRMGRLSVVPLTEAQWKLLLS